MVVSFRWSKCLYVFVGVAYMCWILEGVICTSANKHAKVNSDVVYVHAKPANITLYSKEEQLLYRRQRRKSLNEPSEFEPNSLGDTVLQFQEYQGVFGRPGIDFPVLSRIPLTKFHCRNVKNSNTGYYADLDTHCQVFHVCDGGRKVSFLCPNGTIFRQSHLICDWWFRVECERSPELYEQSVQQLVADQHVYKQRAQTISNAMQNALSKGVTHSVILNSPVSVINSSPNKVFNSESDLPRNFNATSFESTTTGFTPSNFHSGVRASSIPQANNLSPPPDSHGFDPSTPPSTALQSKLTYSQFQSTSKNLQSNNFASYNDQYEKLNTAPTPSLNAEYFSQPDGSTNVLTHFKPDTLRNSNHFATFNQWPSMTRFIHTTTTPSSPLRSRSTNFPATSVTFPHVNSQSNSPSTSGKNFNTGSTSPRASLTERPAQLSSSNAVFNMQPNFNKLNPANYNPSKNANPSISYLNIPQWATVSPTLPPLTTSSTIRPTSKIPPATANTPLPILVANTLPRSQQASTFATTPANIANNYYQENQLLSETASFAGNEKYLPLQNYYYNQNFLNQVNINPTTQTPLPDTTYFLEQTTFPSFDSLFDARLANATNETFALYFPSDDNVIGFVNEGTLQPDIFSANASKPSVSQILLNSLSTKPASTSTEFPSVGEMFPILLTNHTQEGYNQLFTKEQEIETTSSDLLSEHSSGLVQSSSARSLPSADSLNERLKFKNLPDFREVAQIFSRALSAYLENPEQFRKILSEVRPTEPPPLEALKSVISKDEVLVFSDDERSTTIRSAASSIIRDPETFAEEINNFMFDPTVGHTESAEFNVNETYYPATFTTNSTPPIAFTVSPLLDYSKITTPANAGVVYPQKSTPLKIDLYEDQRSKFYDANAQSLQDEPLLITADTQSFVSPDNWVKYQNYGQYSIQPPSLKTSGYPQLGMRMTAPSARITFRADVTTSRTSNIGDESLRTTLNVLSPDTSMPVFNESSLHAMMHTMKEAKMDPVLRNKLVLLLVNELGSDGAVETKSVRDVKSKLLKALLVPSPTKSYNAATERTVSRHDARKEDGAPVSGQRPSSTIPPYRAAVVSKSTENMISRSGRPPSPSMHKEEANRLDDTDSRAIDLLKTLFSLTSNNWS